MKCSDAIVKLLEDAGIKYVFGHPGEHVLPLYDSLRTSRIEHVLLRHEQGVVHAADGYARASGGIGVCISTGGPGALNLVMGVATAYKDSIPLIVITGDIPRAQIGLNVFQEVELEKVFKPITRYTFKPENGEEAISALKRALLYSRMEPMGPIHININKDIFQEEVGESIISGGVEYSPTRDYTNMGEAISLLESSRRPLIVAGAGVLWARAEDDLRELIRLLDDFKVEDYNLDLGIARGLDYYTGIVFEIYVPSLGAQKQICGGGTYNLIELFSGEKIQSTGFAFGFDRLVAALKKQKDELFQFAKVFVAPVSDSTRPPAYRIVQELREEGIPSDVDLSGRKLRKILSYADHLNVEKVILVGERDLKEGKVTIKDMKTGSQELVEIDKIIEYLKEE